MTQTWRARPVAQQPGWPDPGAVRAVTEELRASRPLVTPAECDRLRTRMAAVARGRAFLVQGGDCAETLDAFDAGSTIGTVRTLLQMAGVLTYSGSVPVVVVGRIAGQYAKPRSQPVEVRGGTALPSYRGDAVNGTAFSTEARTPDPRRMLAMYEASARTLGRVREFLGHGPIGPRDVHLWNEDFVRSDPQGRRYRAIADDIGRAFGFLDAHGVTEAAFSPAEFYASHEALLLDYESALTRRDPDSGEVHGLSGHMLWIGERTRQIGGAHLEFASRIRNPVAVKLGPTATARDALELVERLDPDREPGRLSFVVRMGSGVVRDRLPDLVERVTATGAPVAWICDPMHGNTVAAASGHKTRRFDDVLDEVSGFFEVHRRLGTHPGGIHVELTGHDVTECVGGGIDEADLPRRYATACDPRLNRSQSLELAFLVAEQCLSREVSRGGTCDTGRCPARV